MNRLSPAASPFDGARLASQAFSVARPAIGCLLLCWIAIAATRSAQAYPIDILFPISSATSSLTLDASLPPFSDSDTKNLGGTLNVTIDLGDDGFASMANFTINSGTITPSGDYSLTLGFPPIGVSVSATGLAGKASTLVAPGIMTLAPGPAVVYNIDASQFLLTIDQGTVTTSGLISQTIDLSEAPIAGSSPPGTMGALTLTSVGTNGYFTRLNAVLSLPVSFQQTAIVGVTEIDLVVTGTVNAATSFDVALDGIAGDFQLDGDVDTADLPLWKTGYGLASGAAPNNGDANADGQVDGADFLIWQRNLGVMPGAFGAVAAVPEPTAIVMCAGALGAAVLARRLAFRFPIA